MVTTLPEAVWLERVVAHKARVLPWVEPRLKRRSAGESDPVDDFLFTYYSFSPHQLLAWHPGLGRACGGEKAQALFALHGYQQTEYGVAIDAAQYIGRWRSAHRIGQLLRATLDRAPTFGCFGMHEWAMVYRIEPSDVRHCSWPLRLSLEQIAAVVDDVGARCTHFDAFRFFTEPARPLNALQLTRDDQLSAEQPGCLHAGMDLYKWAYKLSPLTSSELVADCFELAREIRAVDMRASPYDLSAAGYRAIAVETSGGRTEYIENQRDFAARAMPLRRRLLDEVQALIDAFDAVSPNAAPDTPTPVAARHRG